MRSSLLASLAVLSAVVSGCSSGQSTTEPAMRTDLMADGGVADSAAPDAGSQSGDAGATIRRKRVFVTKQAFDGNLQRAAGVSGGIEAADALCQRAADGAKLGGSFRALVHGRPATSTSGADESPFLRLKDVSPWYPDPSPQIRPNISRKAA